MPVQFETSLDFRGIFPLFFPMKNPVVSPPSNKTVLFATSLSQQAEEGIQGKRVTTAAKRMVFVIVLIQKCTFLLSKIVTSE